MLTICFFLYRHQDATVVLAALSVVQKFVETGEIMVHTLFLVYIPELIQVYIDVPLV